MSFSFYDYFISEKMKVTVPFGVAFGPIWACKILRPGTMIAGRVLDLNNGGGCCPRGPSFSLREKIKIIIHNI